MIAHINLYKVSFNNTILKLLGLIKEGWFEVVEERIKNKSVILKCLLSIVWWVGWLRFYKYQP